MKVILSNVHSQIALPYLDDIVKFSKSPKEHIKHVRQVLTVLHNAGFPVKLNKCKFFSNTINYLGHGILPAQLAVSQHIIDAVGDVKPLTYIMALQSFLGL